MKKLMFLIAIILFLLLSSCEIYSSGYYRQPYYYRQNYGRVYVQPVYPYYQQPRYYSPPPTVIVVPRPVVPPIPYYPHQYYRYRR